MTPEEYNALGPREAREAARRLSPAAQLKLAVALSATRPAAGVGAVYNFWLRLWVKPALVQERFL